MSDLTLVIGSKRFSSWSLRPWLFLQHHGVPFCEVIVALRQPHTAAAIARHSPSGHVPVLLGADFAVWESQAICEFCAETFALPTPWPHATAARAMARSVAQEMHAGFGHLRRELSFDALRVGPGTPLGAAAQADLDRIRAIWREARARFGQDGPWLFGAFGIADAMFAPVALRLHQYAVPVEGAEAAYVAQVRDHPAVRAWTAQARADEVPAS